VVSNTSIMGLVMLLMVFLSLVEVHSEKQKSRPVGG
jgi:hypothetical protein